MTDDQLTTEDVVLDRTFEAPPDLVWRMWTEPDHFREWYGPSGAEIPEATMDVRVGGLRRIEMNANGGAIRMWFIGEYVEVEETRRLVYTESMADEQGNLLSPAEMGMPGDQPTTTKVTLELEDLGGRTRLVLTHAGIPAGSPGAAGWTMALNKLAAHVASAAA